MPSILYDPLFQSLFSIFLLILVGSYLRTTGFLSITNHRFLTTFCLNFVLPNFIITSFMQDIDQALLSHSSSILIWCIIIHIVLLLGSYFFYEAQTRLSSDEKILLRNLLPMGSIPFFGMAMATSIYGNNGMLATNIYSIPFRIFLYTISSLSISGIRLKKRDLMVLIKNPALLASFVGLFIFFSQNITPHIYVHGKMVGILRFDYTLPFLFHTVEMIGSILTPLIWILIGSSLVYEDFFGALKSSKAIIFALQKVIVLPLVGLAVYIILKRYFSFSISKEFICPILMLLVCPPSNVLVVLSIEHKRAPRLCLTSFVMSTIGALIVLPFYTLFLNKLAYLNII